MSEVSNSTCADSLSLYYRALVQQHTDQSNTKDNGGSMVSEHKHNADSGGLVYPTPLRHDPPHPHNANNDSNTLSNAPTPPAVVHPKMSSAQHSLHLQPINTNTLLIAANDQNTGQPRVFACRLQTELSAGQQIHIMSNGSLHATTLTQLYTPADGANANPMSSALPGLGNNGMVPQHSPAALLFNPLVQSLAAKSGLLPQQLLSRLASVSQNHTLPTGTVPDTNGAASCSLPTAFVDSKAELTNQHQYARLLAAAAVANQKQPATVTVTQSNTNGWNSATSSMGQSTKPEAEPDDDPLSMSPTSGRCSSSGLPINATCNKAPNSAHEADEHSLDGINLEEIKDFARAFKMKRLSLGLTQTQVGQALSMTEGPAYSQSAICRFEKLDITPKSAQKIKPVLEKWMCEMDEQVLAGVLQATHAPPDTGSSRTSSTSTQHTHHNPLNGHALKTDPFDLNEPDDDPADREPLFQNSHSPVIKHLLEQQQLQAQALSELTQTRESMDQSETDPSTCLEAAALAAAGLGKKRKRRTSFTPTALDLLNRFFERNTHPSGAEMTALAESLNYEREVVRVWFCNKRQALKNTIKKLKNNNKNNNSSGLSEFDTNNDHLLVVE